MRQCRVCEIVIPVPSYSVDELWSMEYTRRHPQDVNLCLAVFRKHALYPKQLFEERPKTTSRHAVLLEDVSGISNDP